MSFMYALYFCTCVPYDLYMFSTRFIYVVYMCSIFIYVVNKCLHMFSICVVYMLPGYQIFLIGIVVEVVNIRR